jgi:hypothetical protein
MIFHRTHQLNDNDNEITSHPRSQHPARVELSVTRLMHEKLFSNVTALRMFSIILRL